MLFVFLIFSIIKFNVCISKKKSFKKKLLCVCQSFECFFKPISKCTFHDAITLTQGQVDFLLPSQANVEDSRKVLLTTGEAYKVRDVKGLDW